MYSARDDAELPAPGCPIRKSPDQSLLSGSPKLFAASHVLHRRLAPRHPPYALSSLTTDVVATTALSRKKPVLITRMRLSKNSAKQDPPRRAGSTMRNRRLRIVQPTPRVELIGIEPTTSWLQTRRSPS